MGVGIEGARRRLALASAALDRPSNRLRFSLAVLLAGTAALALLSPWSEALGATTGALCVWLAARSDPWTWPLGIANNLLYLVIFWGSRLYADALLQLVYAAISVYGIWRWRGGASGAAVRPVERASRAELAAVAAAADLVGQEQPRLEALDRVVELAQIGDQLAAGGLRHGPPGLLGVSDQRERRRAGA